MKIGRVAAAIIFLCVSLGSFAAKPDSHGPDPDAILRDLYKAHDAQKGPFYERENGALLEKYFTKELAGLIRKDAVESKGEIGAIEFDPLYASQDPQVKEFKIGAVQWGGTGKRANDPRSSSFALVTVAFKDNAEARELRFDFEQQPDKTWRISDIHYPDGSSILELYRGTYPK